MARVIPRTDEEKLRAWNAAVDAIEGRAPQPTGASILDDAPRISDLPEFVQEWVWTGRLPIGQVTTVVGPRGAAKSYFIAEIVARLSRGEPWPDEPNTPNAVGDTLIISAEDDPTAVIAPRIRKCGVDGDRVRVRDIRRQDGRPAELSVSYVERLAEEMPGLKLVIIDPFAEVLGGRNDRRKESLKVLLNQLARFAERRKVAVLLVNAVDRVSTGKFSQYGVDVLQFLQAGSRSVWSLEEDPNDAGRFLWLSVRANLAESRPGLAFRIEKPSGKIVWEPEPVALRAEDVKAANRPMSKVTRAGNWLRTFLQGRGRTASEVVRFAALEGITRGTLYEAKGHLGILSDKSTDTANGPWLWVLPEWLRSAELPQDSKILVGGAHGDELRMRNSDGARCDAPHPNPPPRRGEGTRGADGPHRHALECRDLPQDSKISGAGIGIDELGVAGGDGARCEAPHPSPPSQRGDGSRRAERRRRRADRRKANAVECLDLPQDSKISVGDADGTIVHAAAGDRRRPSVVLEGEAVRPAPSS